MAFLLIGGRFSRSISVKSYSRTSRCQRLQDACGAYSMSCPDLIEAPINLHKTF
jgi:hypothetical protein